MSTTIEELDKCMFLANDIICTKNHILRHTISLANSVAYSKQEKISKLPFHFNVITSAARGKLRETGHSRILCDLLHHQNIRKDFIKFFFPDVDCDNNDFIIEKEFGDKDSHIDLILYNDKDCIIVENKVNNAVEQYRQIYRYIFDIAISKLGRSIEHIYVLYLNKNDYSIPSVGSLTDQDGNNNIIETLGNRFKVGNFSNDIISWLNQLNPQENEKYLISGILQYKDYLEIYCETSNIYTPMHNEIKSELFKQLGLGDSPSDNIIKLNNQIDNIKELDKYINELLDEERMKRKEYYVNVLHKLILKMKEDFKEAEIYNIKEVENRFVQIGLSLMIRDLKVNFHIEYDANIIESDKCLCFGIICSKASYKDAYDKTCKMFNDYKYTNMMQVADNWPIWAYKNEDEIYESFKALVQYALELNNE